MTLSLSLSPLSLSFSMQIQTIRLCSLYSLASSLDSRVIFGLYRPFRAFLMMYFDSESRYSYDYGVHLPLTVSAILVLYNVTCYIYMRNFANFCILVWIHMDAHEYVFFFQNLNILCIFSDRFFDPVFFRFRFGSVFWVDRFNDRSGSGNFAFT
jgi:hypothetical protein